MWTWRNAGYAVLFVAWVSLVFTLALCRASAREDALHAIARAAHDPQDPTP